MAVQAPSPRVREPYGGRSPYPLVVGGEEVATEESFAAIEPSTGKE